MKDGTLKNSKLARKNPAVEWSITAITGEHAKALLRVYDRGFRDGAVA